MKQLKVSFHRDKSSPKSKYYFPKYYFAFPFQRTILIKQVPELFKEFSQQLIDAAKNFTQLAKRSPDPELFPLLRLAVGSQRLRLKCNSSGYPCSEEYGW